MTSKKLYDQNGTEFDNDINPAGIVIGYAIGGTIILAIAGIFSYVISAIILVFMLIGIVVVVKELARGKSTRIIVSAFLAFISDFFIYFVAVEFTYFDEAVAWGDTGGWILFIILVIVSITNAPVGQLSPYPGGLQENIRRPSPTSTRIMGQPNTYQQPRASITYNSQPPVQPQEYSNQQTIKPQSTEMQTQPIYCSNCGEKTSGKFCGICGTIVE